MSIITKFINFTKSFEKFSLNIYTISSFIGLVSMRNNIPPKIMKQIEDSNIIYNLEEINEKIELILDDIKKLSKVLKKSLKKKEKKTEPYATFKVDENPIFSTIDEMRDQRYNEKKKIKSFEQLNQEHIKKTGSPIKPVISKTNRVVKSNCPSCNAPAEYIYCDGANNKFKCKCCSKKFSEKTYNCDDIGSFCPHCKQLLYIHHDRSNYLVYRCRYDKCSFYLENKKLYCNGEKEKLRYTFRSFKFTINDVTKPNFKCDTKVDLSKIHHSPKVLGLVLSFYINYGCSTRKTSSILRDLYGIQISHQTIYNYAEAAAAQIQHLVSNYPYDLSNVLTGDETYIKAKGKNKYVFFFSDPIKKIITSYKIYDHRNTKSAVESIMMSLKKYEKIPKDLLIITDGNPIYNAAQLFLAHNNYKFNLKQVIGVSNDDDVSRIYRPYKQIEERLNRTYKQNYHGTTGYKSLKCANIYMVLFVAFFNFLRPNSSLNYDTPVYIQSIDNQHFMYDKWLSLLTLSSSYIN